MAITNIETFVLLMTVFIKWSIPIVIFMWHWMVAVLSDSRMIYNGTLNTALVI